MIASSSSRLVPPKGKIARETRTAVLQQVLLNHLLKQMDRSMSNSSNDLEYSVEKKMAKMATYIWSIS